MGMEVILEESNQFFCSPKVWFRYSRNRWPLFRKSDPFIRWWYVSVTGDLVSLVCITRDRTKWQQCRSVKRDTVHDVLIFPQISTARVLHTSRGLWAPWGVGGWDQCVDASFLSFHKVAGWLTDLTARWYQIQYRPVAGHELLSADFNHVLTLVLRTGCLFYRVCKIFTGTESINSRDDWG